MKTALLVTGVVLCALAAFGVTVGTVALFPLGVAVALIALAV